MTDVQAIIWDIDGTLLNSNNAHAEAFRLALRLDGISVDYQRIRRLIGMGSDHLLPAAANIPADSAVGKRILKKKDEIFKSLFFPSLQPFPHARDLVGELAGRGLRMCVATSASAQDARDSLERVGVRELIEAVTNSDDVDSSKPDPDLVRAALGRLGLKPAQALFVGDTPYDVEAGQRAGVPVIAFRCGGWTDRELNGAAAVYRDPADFLSHLRSASILGGLGTGPGSTSGNVSQAS